MDHKVKTQNEWQTDIRRTGSPKDSRRITKGWQRDAKRIAKGQIVWKERFFEG